MKQRITVGMLTALLLVGAGSVAWAGDGGLGDTQALTGSVSEVIQFLLKVAFGGFLVVGCYIVITSLVDAKKQGGWGHFVVGVFMVLIAGIALWTITTLADQNPKDYTQGIRVRAGEQNR